MFRYLSVLTVMAGLSACATGDDGPVTRLPANPALTGGTYSSGGGLTIASVFRPVNGRTALCGTWSESQALTTFTRDKARDILASAALYLDGDRLATGLGFLRQIPPTTDYAGRAAPCHVTARPWHPADAGRVPDIRLPARIVHRNRRASTDPIVTFRQTGPGALGGSLDILGALFSDTVRRPLGATPARASGRYSSGGGLRVAADLQRIDGRAFVCGVWAERRGPSAWTAKQAPEVLARGTALLDGKPALTDLRVLRRAGARGLTAGAIAPCADTGLPWPDPGHRPRLTLRLAAFDVHHGPGPKITFRPDPP